LAATTRILIILLVIGIAGAATYRAGILLAGDLTGISYSTKLRDKRTDRTYTAEELAGIEAGLERSVLWDGNPETASDLGYVKLFRADLEQDGKVKSTLLTSAGKLLRTSLAVRPSYPHGWLWLAMVAEQTGAPEADIVRMLELSLVAGPYERELLLERTRLMAKHASHFTQPERRAAFEQQIRYTLNNHPLELATIAVGFRILDVTVSALRQNPERLTYFISLLKEHDLMRFYRPARS
jgi:hypothetical protein